MSPPELPGALYWPLLDSGLFFALRLSTLGHSRKEKVQINSFKPSDYLPHE